MELSGGCHCGSVRYRVNGELQYAALCHCSDCRKSAGAPVVSWAAFANDALTIEQGNVTTHNSSGSAMRSFCPRCGTGLFYRNEAVLPGLVDIQSATLDDPDALPPQVHIQVAERINWMESQHSLPTFDRYPAGPGA